jgi:hypothetical protein
MRATPTLAGLVLAACNGGFRVEAVASLPASITSATANGEPLALREQNGLQTLAYARDFDSYRAASGEHIRFVFTGSDASSITVDIPVSACEDACASPSCPTADEITLERFSLEPFSSMGHYAVECSGDDKDVAVIP